MFAPATSHLRTSGSFRYFPHFTCLPGSYPAFYFPYLSSLHSSSFKSYHIFCFSFRSATHRLTQPNHASLASSRSTLYFHASPRFPCRHSIEQQRIRLLRRYRDGDEEVSGLANLLRPISSARLGPPRPSSIAAAFPRYCITLRISSPQTWLEI